MLKVGLIMLKLAFIMSKVDLVLCISWMASVDGFTIQIGFVRDLILGNSLCAVDLRVQISIAPCSLG